MCYIAAAEQRIHIGIEDRIRVLRCRCGSSGYIVVSATNMLGDQLIEAADHVDYQPGFASFACKFAHQRVVGSSGGEVAHLRPEDRYGSLRSPLGRCGAALAVVLTTASGS